MEYIWALLLLHSCSKDASDAEQLCVADYARDLFSLILLLYRLVKDYLGRRLHLATKQHPRKRQALRQTKPRPALGCSVLWQVLSPLRPSHLNRMLHMWQVPTLLRSNRQSALLALLLLPILSLCQWQLQQHQLAQLLFLAGAMPQLAGATVGQTLLAQAQKELGEARTVAVDGHHTDRARRRLPWGQIQVHWARALEACPRALEAKLVLVAARLVAVLAAMQRRLLRTPKLMYMHTERALHIHPLKSREL